MKGKLSLIASAFLVFTLGACTKMCQKEPATKAKVFFIEPENNATVTSPFKVVFGVEGMKVRPAGQDIADKTSGHHHLLIDNPQGVEKGQVVPTDDKHIHYGKGEGETMLTLPEGPHTLTLQFADGAHISYGKDLAATIKVNVVKGDGHAAKGDKEGHHDEKGTVEDVFPEMDETP